MAARAPALVGGLQDGCAGGDGLFFRRAALIHDRIKPGGQIGDGLCAFDRLRDVYRKLSAVGVFLDLMRSLPFAATSFSRST
jgi:hypothetical protein